MRLTPLTGSGGNQEGRIGEDIAHGEVGQAYQTSLYDGEGNRFVFPTNQVSQGSTLVGPNNGFDQLLPVTAPRDEEHEASSPDQVSEEEHPSPDGEVIYPIGVVTVD